MPSWVTVTEWSPVGLQTSTAPMFRCYEHCKTLFYGLRLTRSASGSLQNQLFSPPGLGKAVFKILQDGLPNPRASSQSVFTPSESCFSEQLGKQKQAEDVGQLGAQTPQPTLLECCTEPPACPLWAWTSGPGIRVGEAKAQPPGWPRQASVNCSCPRETPGC